MKSNSGQGGPQGWNLSWFQWHEATESIATPPLDGMLVHHRAIPSSMSPVPIYTPGWRETMWDKVSGLRKQHDGRKAMKFAC